MNTALLASTLLAEVGTADSAKSFFSDGLGAMIQNVFVVIGILIVIVTLGRSIKAFSAAKFGDVAKNIIGGVIAAVLCFNLSLPFALITGLTRLVEALFETVGGFFG